MNMVKLIFQPKPTWRFSNASMDTFLVNFKALQIETDLALARFLKNIHSPVALYTPVKYVVATGGKRIRPILVLWAAEAICKKSAAALPAAVAVELFHTFTLVHDDIMDKATLRRNYPTINSTSGNNTAILAGDTLLGLAYKSLLNLNPKITSAAATLLTDALITVCEGQSDDEESGKITKVTLATYYTMISKKTAALLETSVLLGALVAGAGKKQTLALKEYAHQLGLGFQVQDDVLDIMGSSKNWGKEFGKDLQNGKKSIPIILAEKYITKPTDKKQFKKLCQQIRLGKEKNLENLKNILEKYSIRERAQKLYSAHYEKARQSLTRLPPSPARTNLLDLTYFLETRK